jgi:two-component system chemotaxis response regulator CheB
MAQMQIVVIGASAGGLEALTDVVAGLPEDLCAAVLAVIHTRPEGTSYLPRILSRVSNLPVSFALNGAPLEPGTIVIAPPDMHLLIRDGVIELGHGPKENGFRPAVDPLFRSAARIYGRTVMGVILSGALDDGTYGLKVIKKSGGTTVVQDPDEAAHPGMPLSALRFVDVDHVARAAGITELIVERCRTSAGAPPPIAEGDTTMARRRTSEPQRLAEETSVEEMRQEAGPASGLTCPDCGGALWELHDGALTRYRCHVGHQFTPESLDAGQAEAVDAALWSAVRVLEEHAAMRRRMSDRARGSGMELVAKGFADSAHESQRQAHTIRELLFGRALPSPSPHSPPATTPRRPRKAAAKRRTR